MSIHFNDEHTLIITLYLLSFRLFSPLFRLRARIYVPVQMKKSSLSECNSCLKYLLVNRQPYINIYIRFTIIYMYSYNKVQFIIRYLVGKYPFEVL